jgi:hypothetical protein
MKDMIHAALTPQQFEDLFRRTVDEGYLGEYGATGENNVFRGRYDGREFHALFQEMGQTQFAFRGPVRRGGIRTEGCVITVQSSRFFTIVMVHVLLSCVLLASAILCFAYKQTAVGVLTLLLLAAVNVLAVLSSSRMEKRLVEKLKEIIALGAPVDGGE